MLFWRSSEGGHNPSSDCCSWEVWVDPVHFWSLVALKQRFFFLMVLAV